MAELIDEEQMEYIEDLHSTIKFCFRFREILKIKLSYIGSKILYIAWHFEHSGIFSVKSSYKLALNLSTLATHASSSDNKNRRCLWQHIWKSDIPPKVKIFAWRLARKLNIEQ